MKFGLWGHIDPHIPTNQLNSCEIVSIRLRQRTETRLYGGEGGIRTLDTGLPYTHFPGVLLQPLGHLSGFLLIPTLSVSPVGMIWDPQSLPRWGKLSHAPLNGSAQG
jgi:hypothetical protein